MKKKQTAFAAAKHKKQLTAVESFVDSSWILQEKSRVNNSIFRSNGCCCQHFNCFGIGVDYVSIMCRALLAAPCRKPLDIY